MAQNDMKAKPAPPERVRSMEGLGAFFMELALADHRVFDDTRGEAREFEFDLVAE